MTSRSTLWISSKSSLDVVLLVNWMMFQLLRAPNTGQCFQSKIGWYCDCLIWDTPWSQVISKILIHATYLQYIRCIENFPWLSLGYNQRWYCLLKPRTPCNLTCGTQHGNSMNFVVAQYMFIFVCVSKQISLEHDTRG